MAPRWDHRHGWRAQLSTPSNPHGRDDDSAGTRWAELRMVFSGTTTVFGSGRALGMVRNIDRLTGADAELGFDAATYEVFPLADGGDKQFRADCAWNYRYDEARVVREHAYVPHVAEGIDRYAAEEFRCQSRSTDGARDFVESNTAHIHGIALTADDYYRMARDRSGLVWSPRSNIRLYGVTAEVTTLARLGGTIALGTDWTYSGSANILRELACASQYNTTQSRWLFHR